MNILNLTRFITAVHTPGYTLTRYIPRGGCNNLRDISDFQFPNVKPVLPTLKVETGANHRASSSSSSSSLFVVIHDHQWLLSSSSLIGIIIIIRDSHRRHYHLWLSSLSSKDYLHDLGTMNRFRLYPGIHMSRVLKSGSWGITNSHDIREVSGFINLVPKCNCLRWSGLS